MYLIDISAFSSFSYTQNAVKYDIRSFLFLQKKAKESTDLLKINIFFVDFATTYIS